MSLLLLVNINAQTVCALVKRQPEQARNHQIEIEGDGAIDKLKFIGQDKIKDHTMVAEPSLSQPKP